MTFTKNWDRLGLDDGDLRRLEAEIISADDPGVVIKGGGGARKIRLALPGKGKRGGVRVIFATFLVHRVVALLDVYAKSEKENITSAEIKARAEIIAELREALERGS
jgi:hypothetical protein